MIENYDEWLEAPAYHAGADKTEREYIVAFMEQNDDNDDIVQEYIDIPRNECVDLYVELLTDVQVSRLLKQFDIVNEVENYETI